MNLEPTEYHNQVKKPDYYWDGKKIPLEDASVNCNYTEFLEHYFDTNLF
jgi:hypothetical protein